MFIKLNKPLIFIDLETTGIDVVKDRIIEISILKISVDEKEESKTLRVNPTIPIPKESTLVHGITDEDIKDCPTFAEIAKTIANFIEGCDIGGYNSNRFDIPLLAEEFLRADVDFDMKNRSMIDVQVIYHKMEPRTLSAAYKFYCNKEIVNAHSANADVIATYEIFKAQLEKYNELEKNIKSLNDYSSQSKNVDLLGRIIYNEEGVEVFNFGKHKGKSVEEVLKREPSYYNWIVDNEFPLYTKKVLTGIKLRLLNNKL